MKMRGEERRGGEEKRGEGGRSEGRRGEERKIIKKQRRQVNNIARDNT